MKRILVFISMLLCFTAGHAQDYNPCKQGDDKLKKDTVPTKEQVGEATSWELRSFDPNEVIGPAGYDSVRWVSINDVLYYTILFENDLEFATAAAQKVDVRFNFPNKAWMKGFGIGGYSFSNMSWTVVKPSNAYQQRIDLKDSLGYYVDLIAGLDVARQQGFWTFTTIDPETGYAPWQAELGLLPVNDSTHVGEGAVTFQLKPYEGLHTGDTISIQASIVFDQNDTIPTNRWTNKIDAGNPESKVSAEVVADLQSGTQGTGDLQSPSAYNLTFTANDDEGGSGVKHILLYMANHNGIYEEIDTVAVDSVLLFPVEAGKQYKLYSIAVDNTGNREPAKMEPDVILNFNLAPTDIALSDTIFQDDLAAGGYVGKLSSIDTEDNKTFTYALAEGEGAIHNDLFQITGDQLQIKNSFKCVEEDVYKVRISTTDEGGLSYSKSFVLHLQNVLEKPKPDTLAVTICEGETCLFHGKEYDKTGFYTHTQSNDYMCDSIYVLNLSIVKPLDMPLVTVEGTHTLVSSAAKGNQWFCEDGTPIEGATEQKFTPTEDGIYYVAASNGSCYSAPSQMYRVQLTDRIDLTLDLVQGWNWISSPLDGADQQNAKQFLTPIQEQTIQLVGTEGTLTTDGWQGTLTTINPKSSYKLQMDEGAQHVWQGVTVRPEENVISLEHGWNNLGYLLAGEKPLSEALLALLPGENDVIKTQDAFAICHNGQWTGTLESMKPGEGYMYYSGQSAQLTYPVTRVFPINNEPSASRKSSAAPWTYNAHQYADNMTVVARLLVNDAQTVEGAYTVGVFSGNECRGIGQTVDGLIFLTIHGSLDNTKSLNLKAYENATSQELTISETIDFKGQHEGTITAPLILHAFDDITGIENITTLFTIYPKPLHNRLFINGATDNIKAIRILATNGQKVLEAEKYDAEGIDVGTLPTGVYVVAIITTEKKVYYEKVLKITD